MDLSAYKTKEFVIDGSRSETYADWVSMTAKLLGRPYFQIHLIFEKEKWSLDEIRTTYHNAVKHHGEVTPQIAWWASRKRRNT